MSVKQGNEHLVIEISSDLEGGDDWNDNEDESWMASLIGIRDELMRGDLRALYIGWLSTIQYADDDDDALEPPVPPGLTKLSPALEALADFVRVSDEMIEVAAAASLGDSPSGPSTAELNQWLAALSVSDKDRYLQQFMAEKNAMATRAEIARRFRESTIPKAKIAIPEAKRRTVGQLLAASHAVLQEKQRKEAELAAKEAARRARAQAEARKSYLDDLARREAAAWKEVDTLIAMKNAKGYDEAVKLLLDLRELAERSSRLDHAESLIRELQRRHSNKPSLIARLDKAKLI
jgi:hypothetical protein